MAPVGALLAASGICRIRQGPPLKLRSQNPKICSEPNRFFSSTVFSLRRLQTQYDSHFSTAFYAPIGAHFGKNGELVRYRQGATDKLCPFNYQSVLESSHVIFRQRTASSPSAEVML